MKSIDRRELRTAIRNSLLIVAIIHILAFLRVFESQQLTVETVWRALRFRLPIWTAWSLVAPGIWLLARYLSSRRLKSFQALAWFVFGCILSLASYYLLEAFFRILFLGGPFFDSFIETKEICFGAGIFRSTP
jgi:hypothetical protein